MSDPLLVKWNYYDVIFAIRFSRSMRGSSGDAKVIIHSGGHTREEAIAHATDELRNLSSTCDIESVTVTP